MRLESPRPALGQPTFHNVAMLPAVAEDGFGLLNVGIGNGTVRADDGLQADLGKLTDKTVALGVGLGAGRSDYWH